MPCRSQPPHRHHLSQHHIRPFRQARPRRRKSELAMESPRLGCWENRLKLLAITVLDFLLDKLVKWKAWTQLLFTNW
ncbi:MAG: hypothetical protein IPN76_30720 [Saprospiraceae bacterium]|nr:hypothetical protein [Saprospiraceae bacterium]